MGSIWQPFAADGSGCRGVDKVRESAGRPESIENRWDVLYREFADVYDRFSSTPYSPPVVDSVVRIVPLRGCVVDVGAGSGSSTIELAKHAGRVIGVEPEAAMRAIAQARARAGAVPNVSFVAGTAESTGLPDCSADAVAGFFTTLYPPDLIVPRFVAEAARVAKPQGVALYVDVAPGHYGGELAPVIAHHEAEADARIKASVFEAHGFSSRDFESTQRYGSLDEIISTYGFIFGSRAIAYLRRTGQTSIRWRFRVYWRERKKHPEWAS
jgi:ubiquinone/menaquinone biosynthesis C-methylase UbiE